MKRNHKYLMAVIILLLTAAIGMNKVKAEERNLFLPEKNSLPIDDYYLSEHFQDTSSSENKKELDKKELRATANYLDVPVVKQIKDNWCWAACMEMLSKYRDIRNYKLQDNIVKTIMPYDPNGGAMEKDMINAVNYVNNYRSKNTIVNWLSMNTLQYMIDYNNPFPIGMNYSLGGAHTILARGYNSLTNMVYIIDPLEGKKHMYSLESLKENVELDGGLGHVSYIITYDYD